MKITKKIITLSLLGLSFINITSAQDFFGEMVKAGTEDGKILMRNYISPYTKGFGSSLNSGWYNTAQTHSIGRPDLTISLNSFLVPSSDRSFDVNSIGLSNTVRPSDLSKTITPTVAGERTDGVSMDVYAGNNKAGSFTMPEGTGASFVPVPTAQLGIGLPFKTDIIVRWIPDINLSNAGKIGLWGFGLKHDFKQWIPGISALPFDMSFLFGYTRFKSTFNLNVQPDPTASPDPANPSYKDQNLTLDVNSYTFGVLASKKLAIITLYGGLAYDVSSTTLNVNGNYPIVAGYDLVNLRGQTKTISNPIQNDIISGANSPKLTLGARLKLAVFTMHADYSFAKYSVFSFGLGVSLGN